jgi:hypothetical protein
MVPMNDGSIKIKSKRNIRRKRYENIYYGKKK